MIDVVLQKKKKRPYQQSNLLDSTLKMGNQMSASNDELLLFNAAKSGDLTKVKELLSKGVGTGYREVS